MIIFSPVSQSKVNVYTNLRVLKSTTYLGVEKINNEIQLFFSGLPTNTLLFTAASFLTLSSCSSESWFLLKINHIGKKWFRENNEVNSFGTKYSILYIIILFQFQWLNLHWYLMYVQYMSEVDIPALIQVSLLSE